MAEYSSLGWTRDWYVALCLDIFCAGRKISASVGCHLVGLSALFIIKSIWLFQVSMLSVVIPKYFTLEFSFNC